MQYGPIGNCMSGVQWSCDWWRHVTLKGQGSDPKSLKLNVSTTVLGTWWVYIDAVICVIIPIGNHTLIIQRSHDRWRYVTRKVKVVTPIPLKLNISKTVRDRRSVQIDHLYETPYCECSDHVTIDVTWPERSRSWAQYLWGSISQLLC